MKTFTKGLLIGVGIGMLFAPMKGDEMRRMLAERAAEWRNSLPEDSWMNQRINQLSERATSARENWRVYAQQAASKARDTSATLGTKARLTGQDIAGRAKQSGQEMAGKAKQTGQDVTQKAKQTAGSATSSGSTSSTSTGGSSTRPTTEGHV